MTFQRRSKLSAVMYLTMWIDQYIPPQSLEEQWDIKGLEERLALRV